MNPALLDLSGYIKFFVGLFALVNPIGIIPVFISMTRYQGVAERNKTNLTANLAVAIILWTSLFLGDAILHVFGISIDSFRIAGGILVVTIAMSMISGKLGEDKQNKQEKRKRQFGKVLAWFPLRCRSWRVQAPSVRLSSGARVITTGSTFWVLPLRLLFSPLAVGCCSALRL